MFTGIVAGQGVVDKIVKHSSGCRLFIKHQGLGKNVRIGNSVAVNGCCLTATTNSKGILTFDVLDETLDRTSFKTLRKGQKVNLELALRAGDELGGHMVSGHIDCVGVIVSKRLRSKDTYIRVKCPKSFLSWVVSKGSVAIDGVSLTVADLDGNGFGVCLIPLTLKLTTLGWKREGDLVNLEGDILAKYAQKALIKS